MKKVYSGILGSLLLFGWFMHLMLRPSEFVILSTNDIHATLNDMGRLATAVKECRDTVFTVVVDAGDRWTGNAYVDLAEDRLPIIRLMNAVGYDVATLGNHEFDAGVKTLARSIEYANFDIVCANMRADVEGFDKLKKQTSIVTPSGVKLAFTGVVTSYANGRPDGNAENFVGLSFEEAHTVAERECEAMKGDVKILLSHMGDDRDRAMAKRYDGYDLIISGHTHVLLDTLVGRTIIGQTNRKLRVVGATRVKMRGDRVVSIEYENIELKNYAKDAEIERLIGEIEANPALQEVVGCVGKAMTHPGLGNLQTTILKEATGAEIGIYHRGGIRLEGLPEGDVTVKMLFDNEPFFSQVHTAEMTPAQLRKLIVSKYNDTSNMKESHRVDLYATTPYKIIVDENDTAYDVKFPRLRENRKYKVAVPDYVARNYKAFEAENVVRLPLLVYDLDVAYFRANSPVKMSNESKQSIVVRKKR